MAKKRGGRGKESSKTPRERPLAAPQTAPVPSEPTRAEKQTSHSNVSSRFARTTAPRELDDDSKREKWGLPPLSEPNKLGPYIVELNVQHVGGMTGAAAAFIELFLRVTGNTRPANTPEGRPQRIAKAYYRCDFSDNEWRALIALDERHEMQERSIYRLWPDFPVAAQTDRSTITIKSDAAVRSFDACGAGITWAIVDSGIDGAHPHFGSMATDGEKRLHSLWAPSVRDLHRSFVDTYEQKGELRLARPPLRDPDWNADELTAEARKALIEEHRTAALTDNFGHGTHVAGIIAGEAPSKDRRRVLERQFKIDADGRKLDQSFASRDIEPSTRLRGVAPLTRLVSLRVLDAEGNGRASQIIQALEYIRERVNDNPKLLRIHGVNLSVGYEFDAEMFACGQSPLCTAVDRLVQEGVVVVTAAGNTGYGSVAASVGASKVGLSNTINDPGNAALAITVGSTHRESPHLYGVSYFSSKGPTGDGRLKPDLVAPGERITSCAAGSKLSGALQSNPQEAGAAYYMDDSGTSMAAPHVSGAIAAFLSIRREFIGKPMDVKRIFLESATPLNRERYFEGHGLVDLMRAIQLV
jgi:subtilisin family serine protease